MKKYLPHVAVLTIILLLVSLFGAVFGKKQTALPPPAPSPVPAVGTAPRELFVPPILNKQSGVVFAPSFSPPKFPTELPVYLATAPDAFSLARGLAPELGFSSAPRMSPRGALLIWEKPGAVFTVQNNPSSLWFKQDIEVTGAAVSARRAKEEISGFLAKHGLAERAPDPSGWDVSFLKTVNSNFTIVSAESLADTIGITYQYVIGEFPLYQGSGAPAGASSLVVGNGISSVSVVLPPSLSSAKATPLVPLESAFSALSRGGGVLISISKTSRSFSPVLDVSFNDVVVDRVSLAYIQTGQPASVSPVYVFSGIVQGGSKESRGARVTYAVSAVP